MKVGSLGLLLPKQTMDASGNWIVVSFELYRDASGQLRDRPSANDTSVQGKRK